MSFFRTIKGSLNRLIPKDSERKRQAAHDDIRDTEGIVQKEK